MASPDPLEGEKASKKGERKEEIKESEGKKKVKENQNKENKGFYRRLTLSSPQTRP